MQSPKILYELLLNAYGEQGWWPVTEKGQVSPVYIKRNALTEKQMLEVCVGTILTQNTSWKNVEKAIIGLNKQKTLNLRKLLEISIDELAHLIKSTGYFNQKALKLKNLAFFLKKNSFKELERMHTEKLRTLFLSVNGIGFETADSILCYAFNRPVFVVDAYTKRLFYRFFGKQLGDYHLLQKFAQNDFFKLTKEKKVECFKEFHALIVEHCKQYCRKKPCCNTCFLNKKCFFSLTQKSEQ